MAYLLKKGVDVRILLGCGLLIFCATPAIAETKAAGAFQRISKMEETMFGGSHRDQPLERRLQELEQKAFGQTQSGSVSKRVAALEQHIQKTKAEFMPPIAPTLDNGYRAPLTTLDTPKQSQPSSSAKSGSKAPASDSVMPEIHGLLNANTSRVQSTTATAAIRPTYAMEKPQASSEGGKTAAPEGPPTAPSIAETVRRNAEAARASSTGLGYVTKEGDQTVLHASATDYGAAGGAQHFTNPLAPNTLPFPPGYPQIQQTQFNGGAQQQRFSAGRAAGALATGVGRAAITGAVRGNVTSAVIGSAARIGLRTALGAAAGGGGGLGSAGAVFNALHCPICRLLH